jgi:hypothetical protein
MKWAKKSLIASKMVSKFRSANITGVLYAEVEAFTEISDAVYVSGPVACWVKSSD